MFSFKVSGRIEFQKLNLFSKISHLPYCKYHSTKMVVRYLWVGYHIIVEKDNNANIEKVDNLMVILNHDRIK